MNAEQIEYLKKLVASLAEWQLCMSYNDSYFGEPAGLVKRTSRELTKLIESFERTTAPVSLTDEQIFAIHDSTNNSDSQILSFARALLAAAPAPIQQEPVLWVESEPSIRDKDARYAINSLCHTVAYHIKKPDTTNPVWPLYAATPARVDTVGGEAARDVLVERQRQVNSEGWTPEHDDQHGAADMAHAAACYIFGHMHWSPNDMRQRWPWAHEWFKPSNRRRNLVKAGALILAEIERLDRAAMREQP